MQPAADISQRSTPLTVTGFTASTDVSSHRADASRLIDFKVIRRNGSVVNFEPGKIAIALTKAFLAVSGGQGAASARVRTSSPVAVVTRT